MSTAPVFSTQWLLGLRRSDLRTSQASLRAGTTETEPVEAKVDLGKLRGDFVEALEQKLQAFGEGAVKVRIPQEAVPELERLQKATQDLEAHFVKSLLAGMRSAALTEDESSMSEFARDMLDQTLAESTSRSQSGLGIAKTIFMATADPLVRQHAAKAAEAITTDRQKENTR